VVHVGGQIRGTVDVSGPLPVLKASGLILAGGLLAFVLVLATIAVFTARAVQRPLAILSRAAHRVAINDLAVTLPASPVREISDVSTAFATMGAALSASLQRQADIEQERRLFISAIVHDLRAPLFSLRGYLQGLEQGLAATPEKSARYMTICRERADALARLVDDLFTYARLEYLEQQPVYAPLDLGELLRNTAETLHPQLQAKGIVLLWEGPAQPFPVSGDAHQLTRAVGNILDNARRYTPEGGTIRVRWRSLGDRAEFTVADSGPGINAEDVPHLFAPLFRGEGSRNRQTGGAGLGLTIARRILLAHDGDLSVANGPHRGAEFTGSIASQVPPTIAAASAAPSAILTRPTASDASDHGARPAR
jgi:signal transduction histidine kinase